LAELAERFPERGFDKLFQIIRRRGLPWNHKRVWRVYCQMQLNHRRRGKRRVPTRHPLPLVAGEAINGSWSVDFMSDALWDGHRFRTFNVIDDFNREALAVEIDLNLPASRVVRTRGFAIRARAEASEDVPMHVRPCHSLDRGGRRRFETSFPRTMLSSQVEKQLTMSPQQRKPW